MVEPSQNRGFFGKTGLVFGLGLLIGGLIVAGSLAAWWLQPASEPVFAVDEGWTDMMRAARNGDAAAVRRLLEEGGDPNAQGGQMGLTPLIVSAANGHREIVELLLTRGASLEAADSAGMTPLMNAVMFDQTAVVQLLLDRGANVNAQTRDGNMTPLMFARSSAAAKVLLLNGADARARTRDGKSAADGAEALGQSDLAGLLRLAERQATGPNLNRAPDTAPAPLTLATNGETPSRTLQGEPRPPATRDVEVAPPPVSESISPVRFDGGEVQRVVFRNPAAGFSIVAPEDWEMATGGAGNIEMAIDASTGASLVCQPAIWFFYSPNAPQQEAEMLASDFQRLGADSTRVRATGRDDEWEVQATFPLTQLGAVWTEWRCRREQGMAYVVGAAVREELRPRFQGDLDAALTSCRLIDHPIVQAFREPTEQAYTLSLPCGWKWEGRILRTAAVPGFFEWKAQRDDELVGCFTAEPAVLNVAIPYQSPREVASGVLLERLQAILPDAQLTEVRELPRVEQCLMQTAALALPGMRPRGGKAVADYVGKQHGTRVRLRVEIATWMPDASIMPGIEGRGNWFIFTSGAWAPEGEFEEAYWLARSVQSSLCTSSQWKRRQGEAVGDVLGRRRGALEEAGAGWDALIRGMERVPDPDGGPIQEVPNLQGQVWKDLEGRMWRVAPNAESEAWVRDQGWRFVR